MNYLKYTPYLYLVAAVFFIYDGFENMSAGESGQWLSFAIAAVAVFMFFFRLRFARKFAERNKKP